MNLLSLMDQWVLHSLYALRTVHDTLFIIDISELGSVALVLGITAIATILLIRKGLLPAALTLLLAVGSTAVVVSLLKYLVARPRPDVFFQAYPEMGYSFPSWHAAGSAALYLTLAYILSLHTTSGRRWILYTASIALTAIVGFTRMYLGVHYASDVIAGWTIGAVLSYASIKYAPRILKLPFVKKYVG